MPATFSFEKAELLLTPLWPSDSLETMMHTLVFTA